MTLDSNLDIFNPRQAARKIIPRITVILIASADDLDLLVAKGYLAYSGSEGYTVHQDKCKNPGKVNIGDYLRVDVPDDVYPINQEYFKANFEIVG